MALSIRSTTRPSGVSGKARRFRLQEAPAQDTYLYSSNFGQITANHALHAAVEASLAEGPLRFAELQRRHDLNLPTLAQLVSLVLHASRVGLDQGEAIEPASQSCAHAHTALSALQIAGRPDGFRPVASLGSAIGFSLAEALLEQALRQDPNADPLPALNDGLAALGRNRIGRTGRSARQHSQAPAGAGEPWPAQPMSGVSAGSQAGPWAWAEAMDSASSGCARVER